MTTLREAAQMALDALTYIHTETNQYEDELIDGAITALRAALAQPEQEPAWIKTRKITYMNFTAPPQREWQGLTDEDLDDAYEAAHKSQSGAVVWSVTKYTEAIEAKLKEKNAND